MATPRPSARGQRSDEALTPEGQDDALLGLVRAPSALLGASGAIAFYLHPGGFREVHAFDIPAGVRPRLRRLFDRSADQLRELSDPNEPHLLGFGKGFVAVVPLSTRETGHMYGVWFAERAPALDAHEARTMAVLAAQVGAVLIREQSFAARMHAAVLAERQRIARDMHDVVIQRILAVGLQLKGMEGHEESAARRAELAGLSESLDFTIEDLRTTIFDLTHGEAANLADNVQKLAAEYDGLLGTPAVVHLSGHLEGVSHVVSDHLLATLRELLSNVARHAGASRCTVTVAEVHGEVVLTVEDDGEGFDLDVPRSGLENIRLRALLLSGELEVNSTAAHGTRVVWRVPVPELVALDRI